MLSILVGGSLIPTYAASIFPQTPEYPPRPPLYVQYLPQPLAKPLSPLALPPLKAVLLVGPIDGNDGDWTRSEISNMELAANVLEANGVNVQRFYPGTGTFADIEFAAEDAHFLLYRGHGIYDGNLPSPNVGGFALSSGYYSPDRIRTNLHLAPNAIVMLYSCFSAGSSSATGDLFDIGIVEASRRVAQYSDPFFDVGASGYYANWYGDAFEHFLSNLFAGQTLGQAYENYFDFNVETVFRTTHPDHPGLSMWIDKDNWSYWQYNNAFSGKYDQTLVDLFTPGPFTISGNAGVAGATLSYTDGTLQTITSDGSGFYSFTVPYNWSGTVTPSKTYYTFSPVNRAYTNVVQNQINQNYTVTISSFADVQTTHWAWTWIERLYSAGITSGCGTNPLTYCPEDSVTRAQMAIFLERGMNGSTFTPPAGTGTVFADVPLSYWAVNWIEKLFTDGITGGCGTNPLIYCPDNPVTRSQMAVFLLRAKHGAAYTPPPAAGLFADVPTTYWAANWIEQLAGEGITTGCGTSPLTYCPEDSVTRAQMAVFLVRTFNLP
jgi:hypothetical protein